MNSSRLRTLVWLGIAFSLSACSQSKPKPQVQAPLITVTTVEAQKTVTLTEQYVCQIQCHLHIKIRAPETGVLDVIPIKEGQTVHQADLLFKLKPTVGQQQRTNKEQYEVVSIKAPFDGTVDRFFFPQDSYVQKGETLTTLSDNSLMWVYFNVAEAQYLEYKAAKLEQHTDDLKFELMLPDGSKFDQLGKFGAIGADFNPGTGSVAFRADFPNPNRQLRHGQRGTLLISRVQNDALVIPQRATFEYLAKRYVFVVDKDGVAHQREIVIQNELDGAFVIKRGIKAGDKIVLEGVRRVRDGDKIQGEDHQAKRIAANLN